MGAHDHDREQCGVPIDWMLSSRTTVERTTSSTGTRYALRRKRTERQERNFNKTAKPQTSYQKGDLVLLFKDPKGKLDVPWVGPFSVLKDNDNNTVETSATMTSTTTSTSTVPQSTTIEDSQDMPVPSASNRSRRGRLIRAPTKFE